MTAGTPYKKGKRKENRKDVRAASDSKYEKSARRDANTARWP